MVMVEWLLLFVLYPIINDRYGIAGGRLSNSFVLLYGI